MALTELDKHHYGMSQHVTDYLAKTVIKPGDRVLEVGPGDAPFKRADAYVDFLDDLPYVDKTKPILKCDVAKDPLPFKDKEFDFVFARHILEDMYNPFLLISEMSRVAKAGYLEVPSPIAEMGRGVDVGSPPFRGYHHHRWIGWNFGKEFRLITKFPFIEYCRFDEAGLEGLLKDARYWNSYFLWEGHINVNHIQSPQNFNIPRDYTRMLADAAVRSREMTDIFFSEIK